MSFSFICGACRERFENRMDHIPHCHGPFPKSWWTHEDGPVLWWCWKNDAWLEEPPYVGTPQDQGHTVELHTHQHTGDTPAARILVGGWTDTHTHWTRLPDPPRPPTDLD